MQRLLAVLEMNAPLITNKWKLQARNAPRANSLILGWRLCCIEENSEPIVRGIVQRRFEAMVSPKMRLRETIESGSRSLMTRVIAAEVAGIVIKITNAAARGKPSSTTSGVRRRTMETARRTERVEKEGRTNRCRYRRANCSVAEPYRLNLPE